MGTNSVSQGQAPAYTNATTETVKASLKAQLEAADLDAKLNAMLGIGTFLTAEDMFAFAESQLRATDKEIRMHVSGITIAKEKAAELQAISAGLREVKNGTYGQQHAKLEELIAKAQQAGLGETANELGQAKALLETQGGQAFSSDKIEGLAQGADAAMTKLTSSAELTMIKIQGLMQSRSQILQLASNVIAALNEPVKNAIGNIRGS